MANAINYVEQFRQELEQKYARELVSSDLTDNGVKFIGTKTVKIPKLTLGGYGEHSRSGGWNRKDLSNDWDAKQLTHDRDVEFYVDVMDVDETNQVASAANITNTFEQEQAIPETDAYRFSKLYADYKAASGTIDNEALTEANVLKVFDKFMEEMDDASVPQDGRILYVTAAVASMLKRAQEISRYIQVDGKNDNAVNRAVRSLDGVKIVTVPKDRFKTAYNFTNGFVPADNAKQINMILVHPRSVIAVDKHSAVYLFAPGQHTGGDGYLYQNRKYGDLFIIENKKDGVKINAEAEA